MRISYKIIIHIIICINILHVYELHYVSNINYLLLLSTCMCMYYRHLKRRINCLEGLSPNALDYTCPACSKVRSIF